MKKKPSKRRGTYHYGKVFRNRELIKRQLEGKN